MKVLVGCEYSGIVRNAFRRRGHDAWSCDLLPCESYYKWHIQGDVLSIIHDGWDLAIFHPPCTYLSVVGNSHLKGPNGGIRLQKRWEAAEFFLKLFLSPISLIAVENPPGYMSSYFRPPDQTVQPYFFGDSELKRTCFWLKNLRPLVPTNILPHPKPHHYTWGRSDFGKARYWTDSNRGWNRSHERSQTFQGIADAMADQWGQE